MGINKQPVKGWETWKNELLLIFQRTNHLAVEDARIDTFPRQDPAIIVAGAISSESKEHAPFMR